MTGATTALPRIGWQDQAACVDPDDLDLFFPIGESREAFEQEMRAKAICAGCPVQEACLDFATHHNLEGVWGGMNHDERRSLARKENRRMRRERRDQQ